MASSNSELNESLFAQIVEEFTDRCHRGEAVDPDTYAQRHPALATVLHQVLPAILALAERRAASGAEAPPQKMQACFPQYEMLEVLGRGGMGAVYKARHRALHRLVAIKVVRPELHYSASVWERFRVESRALAALQHPNILQIYEVGEADGAPYLVLEYCGGGSLACHPAHLLRPPREAARLTLTIARAVHTAHEVGLVHRDLKPANILLTRSGEIKVSDFGLVKRMNGDAALTNAGAILGTPNYMAPEQAGEDHVGVGPAADIHALGAILYDLATGRPPFQAGSVLETIELVRRQEPTAPRRLNRAIPRDLETICLKCLRKDPRERYSSAADLADDLEAFLAHRPIRARRVTLAGKAFRLARRSPLLVGALSLLPLAIALGATGMLWIAHRAQVDAEQATQTLQAAGLANAIVNADAGQLPVLLQEMHAHQGRIEGVLRRRLAEGSLDAGGNQRLNVALALFPSDPSQRETIWEQMFEASPWQLTAILDAIGASGSDLTEHCVQVFQDPSQSSARRFRAACVLSRAAPSSPVWSDGDALRRVAEELVRVAPSELGAWRALLQPVFSRLAPPLLEIKGDSQASPQARLFAFDLLSDHYSSDAAQLVELTLDADASQFPLGLAKLRGHRTQAIPRAADFFQSEAPVAAAESDQDLQAERQARAAALLVHLGAGEVVWPAFRHTPDPRLRGFMIHHFPQLAVPPDTLWDQLGRQENSAVRFALLLCLGGFSGERLPPSIREEALPVLLAWHERDPDPGVHSAVAWLLRQWGHAEAEATARMALRGKNTNPENRRWYVNGAGQTFAILQVADARIGSPEGEQGRHADETLHVRRIQRTFALATTEVTVGEFQRFRQALGDLGQEEETAADLPIAGVTWYEAAAWCNWLSEQEGIPPEQWCYEPNAAGVYGEGMRARPGFLELGGYRLPTEAEWEFACRSGAVTSRYYGHSERLLAEYAWYSPWAQNRTHPVGLLRPNDFGLFDVLGNVYEWCHDLYQEEPPPRDGPAPLAIVDLGDSEAARDFSRRVLRGGSFDHSALHARAAFRTNDLLIDRIRNNGFRPARTLSP